MHLRQCPGHFAGEDDLDAVFESKLLPLEGQMEALPVDVRPGSVGRFSVWAEHTGKTAKCPGARRGPGALQML